MDGVGQRVPLRVGGLPAQNTELLLAKCDKLWRHHKNRLHCSPRKNRHPHRRVPCQPYSAAGKRLGTEDDRHLWPEMLRAIREIKPRWVVGENVSGLLSWNEGVVFEEVQADLEAEGYEVQAFVLPAAGIGAPHRRDRVWIVAYCESNRDRGGLSRMESTDDSQWKSKECRKNNDQYRHNGSVWSTTDTGDKSGRAEDGCEDKRNGQLLRGEQQGGAVRGQGSGCSGEQSTSNPSNKGLQGRTINGSPETSRKESHKQSTGCFFAGWENFPTQSPVRSRNDGLSRQLVRYLTQEVYDEIGKTSKENRIQNLQEVWERVQSPEVWEEIRRLYSLESKEILLQTMQLYSRANKPQGDLSPFSERVSERFLQKMRRHGEFRSSPQGQELQKQRSKEFGDSLSFMPHEVALAARSFETAITKFDAWHRNESIKGYGNAIVPQVALQIFKAIEQMEK